MSEAQSRASTKWNNKHDCITIRPEKEVGAKIRQAAKDAGQSVQQFILEAVELRFKCH